MIFQGYAEGLDSPTPLTLFLVNTSLVENFADLVRWQLQKVDPHIGAVA